MTEPLRILIVDDDPRMVSTLADILIWQGYRVATACSVAEALERASGQPFDCAISDIRMPGMDGVALYQALRALWPDLPMILMTAYAAEELVQTSRQLGVLGVLDKPLKIKQVLDFLTRLQQPRTVVIVDDDPVFAQTLGDILERHSFVVKTITDPERLLVQAAETINGQEEIVLLDMKLKGLDGRQVLQQIRSRHRKMPILLVTGYGEEMAFSIQQALQMKAYACLYKPLAIPELLHLLDEIRIRQMQEALSKR